MMPGRAIPPDRRRDWGALLILMLGYSALFAVFYPPISGVEDEVGFLNQALVWSRGAVSAEGAGLSGLSDFAEVHGRQVATRHPGRSLVALPFLMIGGVRATFASGLLLHLGLTAIAAALLARLGRSPLWAVLLLCHPTLALYSRTILADAPAGTGLLLAALAATYSGSAAAIGAGLAVGLAALMRYHAALALPIVAATFRFPAGRPHPWREAALCLLAGGLAGGLIVAYNLAVYGSPVEPFSGRRGFFAREFLVPHARFYASALLVVWPGMLIAPALDRSPLRWLVRGVCILFLGSLVFYYFHDQRPRWFETAIVGQRLLQVALPLWIVSYAGVVDDWLAGPLRRRLGSRAWMVLVTLACAALLAFTGLIFDRHQHHLKALLEARDSVAAHVPDRSLIVFEGSLTKLVGVPLEVPFYRLKPLTYRDQWADDPRTLFEGLERERVPWFLAVLRKAPGEPLSKHAHELIARFRMERVPVRSPLVSLHACRGGSTP